MGSWRSRSISPIVRASARCASSRSGIRWMPSSRATTRTKRPAPSTACSSDSTREDGLLHFVGHSRVYNDAAEIAKLLEPLKGGTGFTGRSTRRQEPLDRQDAEDDPARSGARRRTQRRPHQRRAVPARLPAAALAHRQSARGLHDGSASAAFLFSNGNEMPGGSGMAGAVHHHADPGRAAPAFSANAIRSALIEARTTFSSFCPQSSSIAHASRTRSLSRIPAGVCARIALSASARRQSENIAQDSINRQQKGRAMDRPERIVSLPRTARHPARHCRPKNIT